MKRAELPIHRIPVTHDYIAEICFLLQFVGQFLHAWPIENEGRSLEALIQVAVIIGEVIVDTPTLHFARRPRKRK